ncbi:MAG: hypothetical protein HPY50_15225 [Firmicutes bacterium]|nr:hypothetical protein [Bacillota bacterium]
MSNAIPENRTLSIRIDFYSENDASVSVDYAGAPDEQELLHCSLMYFAKVLAGLGSGEPAELLVFDVTDALLNLVQDSAYISEPPRELEAFVKIRLVDPLEGPNKTYKAEFYDRQGGKLIQTSYALGDEEQYAPSSVLALLQHLFNHLSFPALLYLLMALRFFLEYYHQKGELSTGQSVVESVSHAINQANRAMTAGDA